MTVRDNRGDVVSSDIIFDVIDENIVHDVIGDPEPAPPGAFFLIDNDGDYLIDNDGDYLYAFA